MSNVKLHPIYAALDAHQYSRAVKLCLALPKQHALGQALLAHAYYKSGQKWKAVMVLHQLLNSSSSSDGDRVLFPELLFRVQHEAIVEQHPMEATAANSASTTSTTTPAPAEPHGARRKGKKKGGKSSAASASTISSTTKSTSSTPSGAPPLDVLEALEQTQLTLPDDWDTPPSPDSPTITDPTTLDTLSITLKDLRLPLTSFQLYLWATIAATAASNTEALYHSLSRVMSTGLHVLCTKSRLLATNSASTTTSNPLECSHDEVTILTHMQVAALQLARLPVGDMDTSWAAQCALWQLQWTKTQHTHDGSDESMKRQQQRLALLPRLAESLSGKLVTTGTKRKPEHVDLHVRILEQQEKYDALLEFWKELGASSNNSTDDGSSDPTGIDTTWCWERQAHFFSQQKHYEQAENVYRQLIGLHSDNWMYWKQFVDCANNHGGMEHAINACQSLVEEAKTQPDGQSHHRLRAPELIFCELQAMRVTDSDGALVDLYKAIRSYAEVFAARASCAYSDLSPYLDLYVRKGNATELAEWAEKLLSDHSPPRDRAMLRVYIFAIKVLCKVVAVTQETRWLPNWKDLVNEWIMWQEFLCNSGASDNAPVQKESQPSDEIILLAVQALLFGSSSREDLLTAAALLEMTLLKSLDNPYLKISAMSVYARLGASRRLWELFQSLGIKHIQLDSCSYLATQMMSEMGLYNELIAVSSQILKLHVTAERDCASYCASAMDRGSLSKVEEFLVFQRERMACSLTLLDAKHYIMNCAPLLSFEQGKHKTDTILGVEHGIVGNESDPERAAEMAKETYNSLGAPSLMALASSSPSPSCESFSDNRDLSVLDYQILLLLEIPSKERIVRESMRSGHIHSLLLRTALCLELTKGPKKGKLTKPGDVLVQRCRSLLDAISRASNFIEDATRAAETEDLLHAMLILCRTVVHVSSGLPEESDEDSVASRDNRASELIQSATTCISAYRAEQSEPTVSSVCLLLPDYLVPLFVLLQMTASVLSIYGWGKRKRDTKASAGALAELASQMKAWTIDAKLIIDRLPCDPSGCKSMVDDLTRSFDYSIVDESLVKSICERVADGQQTTRDRVGPLLNEIVQELSTFETHDSDP